MVSNESIVAAELNGVITDINAITNIILPTTDQRDEVTVEIVVADVIEDLLMLVCDSPSGDEPPETLYRPSIPPRRDSGNKELLMLVCDSPSGDAPPETLQTVDTSVKGTSVAVDGGPQGDAAIPVNHVLPDKKTYFASSTGTLIQLQHPNNVLLIVEGDFLPRCGDASNVLYAEYVALDADIRSKTYNLTPYPKTSDKMTATKGLHGRCSAVSRLRTFSDYPLHHEFAVVVSSVAYALDPLVVVRAPSFFGHAERRIMTTRQLVSDMGNDSALTMML
ncbi:Uncharacterized protein FWK35_00007023 [Aphis craccivora]|uniref:Uncharacterized protein n=1 Tax=Aphis craccivora TaxID=307492 RepID=A0A6G0ZFS1_APHCR|nr:Uncharacterized protein FWK35_00007023 [Aphis craccivora]